MELIERIRERAYQLWEAEGCEHGHDMKYWFMAEAQTADEQAAVEQIRASLSSQTTSDVGSGTTAGSSTTRPKNPKPTAKLERRREPTLTRGKLTLRKA